MKEIQGWNTCPDNFRSEITFSCAPLWLRILARTVYFERFAYPIAVEMGFGRLFPNEIDPSASEEYFIGNWKVINRRITDSEKVNYGQRSNLLENLSIKNKLLFWQLINAGKGLTFWGTQQKQRKRIHKLNGTWKIHKSAK